MAGPIYQKHHTIEQQTLNNSELLDYMQRTGAYDIHAPHNLIHLPADRQLAQDLGLSPHSGGPIRDYQRGTMRQMIRLEQSFDGHAALEGDPEAMARIVPRVDRLTDTMRLGLINGDLYTNTPLGLTPGEIRPQIQGFYTGVPAYQAVHAPQLDTLRSLQGPEIGWASIVHNEGRIITTLQHMERTGDNLLRGGDAVGARTELSQAITRAYTDSRLNLSSQGIDHISRTLGEEAAEPLRVPRGMRGFATPELLAGELSTNTLIRSGGLLASGAEMIMSARRSAELAEQSNDLGARSQMQHAVARNAGAWAGGSTAAYALGASGYGPAALVAADAVLMSKAFDKAADLWDNHQIYNQTDRDNVDWKFTGPTWVRQGAIDRTQDGVSNPVDGTIAASYDKSRELSYLATNAAVKLAMADAPRPMEPFKIPAGDADRIGLDNPDWQRNADTGQWLRQVKMGVSGANDRGEYREQVATPERADQLNQEAVGRVAQNVANSREAIAARYMEHYTAQRSRDFGGVPDAVQAALPNPDVLTASDRGTYRRNETGEWTSNGQVAQGNVALELETTRAAWQPTLAKHEQTVAELQARPAPTLAEQQQSELLYRYRSVGTELNPEWQQAIELATQRTREANGLTGAGSQQLLRNAQGQLVADSPIAHFQRGPDGVDRIAATTSTEDIQRALGEVRGRVQGDNIQTMAAVSVSAPRMGSKPGAQDQEQDQPARSKPMLADHPSHPDFDTFNRIHEWVRGTGQWDEEKSRNVAGALFKEQTADPLLKRVDKVCGGVGCDGAENVFAVYAPFGDKPPVFTAHVDGREACQQPAQQNLEQAEQIKQQQVIQQQQDQQQQQNTQQQVAKGPMMSM